MNHLDQINKKFAKVIDSNFGHEFGANVVVSSVVVSPVEKNTKESPYSFVVKHGEYLLNCITELDSSTLNINDKIQIQGRLVADKTKLGSVCIMVNFFCLISDQLRLKDSILKYNELRQKLNDVNRTELQQKINKMHRKRIPNRLTNIGIVVLESHKFILDTFKTQFQDRCTGNLVIYTVPDTIITTHNGITRNNFLDGLEYFNSKNRVDCICILTDALTLDQILILSSAQMIKKMYKYTDISSYIVSVSQTNKSVSPTIEPNHITDYLCRSLTNKQFTSVCEYIDLIGSTQTNYKKKITQAIQDSTDKIFEIIQMYQQKLTNLELNVVELNSTYMRSNNHTNPYDRLTHMITNRLDTEKNKLVQMELSMMKSLIDIVNSDQTRSALKIYEELKSGKAMINRKQSIQLPTQLPEQLSEQLPVQPSEQPSVQPLVQPLVQLPAQPSEQLLEQPSVQLPAQPLEQLLVQSSVQPLVQLSEHPNELEFEYDTDSIDSIDPVEWSNSNNLLDMFGEENISTQNDSNFFASGEEKV